MFRTKSNCAKCIDIYENGLRNEPEFKKSLKKLNANEKKEIDKEIKVRRKAIHKKFGDIFRDEAQRMLNVMNSFDPSKSIRKTKRLSQQFRNAKNKKSGFALGKSYRDNMRKVLETMDADAELDPEEIAFQEEMASVAKAKNILKATEYNPEAYKRNLRTMDIYRNNKSELTKKERKAGIKSYRYSAKKQGNTSDDYEGEVKPKKKTLFENIFGTSKKKGGRRTRKKRKKRRTRKKRKKRRRRTRK